ncbi:MAG: murein transglycosylase A [Micropepsaceae bacterium]
MRALRIAISALLVSVSACVPFGNVGREEPAAEDRLVLAVSGFDRLSDWPGQSPQFAFQAFQRSCATLSSRRATDAFGGDAVYGTVGDWKPACQTAMQISANDKVTAQHFFETWFVPAQVRNQSEPSGLFTGYYEPELDGSRKASRRFRVPLYARPADLVQVDLGAFRPALKGERIAGRVSDGKLVPYATRAQIVDGTLGPKGQPIVYVDDAVAAFFLQIQGSGRIKLDNGETIRAAFDGQNGFPYTAIGRTLVSRGEIPRENLSMQSIRTWLQTNPTKADALMNENASYVFFKEQPIADASLGASGAQGVPLTAEASLAVDMKFHALGAPLWIEAKSPAEDANEEDAQLRKLVIAQDTGGAIRGPVRGDIYWGVGSKAENIAGRMAHKGTMFVLLPKVLAQHLN